MASFATVVTRDDITRGRNLTFHTHRAEIIKAVSESAGKSIS